MKTNKEEQFFCLEVKGLMKGLRSKGFAGIAAFLFIFNSSLPLTFAANTVQAAPINQKILTAIRAVQAKAQTPAQQLVEKMRTMLADLKQVATVDPKTITISGFKLKALKNQPGTVTLHFVYDPCSMYTGHRCEFTPKELTVEVEVSGNPSDRTMVMINRASFASYNSNPLKLSLLSGDSLSFKIAFPMVTLKDAGETLAPPPAPVLLSVGGRQTTYASDGGKNTIHLETSLKNVKEDDTVELVIRGKDLETPIRVKLSKQQGTSNNYEADFSLPEGHYAMTMEITSTGQPTRIINLNGDSRISVRDKSLFKQKLEMERSILAELGPDEKGLDPINVAERSGFKNEVVMELKAMSQSKTKLTFTRGCGPAQYLDFLFDRPLPECADQDQDFEINISNGVSSSPQTRTIDISSLPVHYTNGIREINLSIGDSLIFIESYDTVLNKAHEDVV